MKRPGSTAAVACAAAAVVVAYFAGGGGASAQHPEPSRLPACVGITNTNYGPWIYRAWSDGTVEVRDVSETPAWQGWRSVDPH